jgi:hypothetical protein
MLRLLSTCEGREGKAGEKVSRELRKVSTELKKVSNELRKSWQQTGDIPTVNWNVARIVTWLIGML